MDTNEPSKVLKLLPLAEVSETLGVKLKTLRNWMAEGRLEYVQLVPGGNIFIKPAELERIIQQGTICRKPVQSERPAMMRRAG